MRSVLGEGDPLFGVPYRGDADCCRETWECCPTVETKASVRDLDACMFLVRISRTSCTVLAPRRRKPTDATGTYLEVCADIPELPLQEQENVLVVLPLLVRFWVEPSGKGLETSDLLVERREVLFDDKRQLPPR